MNESIKIEEVLQKEVLNSEYASMETFIQSFNSYLQDMNITWEKKQLVMRPNDTLPCLVSINGFRWKP